jgi:transposase-like protein
MTEETNKRRNCSEDFKQDAVALVTEPSYKTPEAAMSLGVGDNLKGRWKREFGWKHQVRG